MLILEQHPSDPCCGRCLDVLAQLADEEDYKTTGEMPAPILRKTLGMKYESGAARGVTVNGGDDLLLALSDLGEEDYVIGVILSPTHPSATLYLRAGTNEPLGCVVVDRSSS